MHEFQFVHSWPLKESFPDLPQHQIPFVDYFVPSIEFIPIWAGLQFTFKVNLKAKFMKPLKSYRKFRTILSSALLLSGLKMTCLQAQEAIPATGGNASGSGGSVSYSVGQVVDTTNTGTNGSVAQGVQQPFEIAVVTGIKEANGITLQYSAYPNPVTDILILSIEGELKTPYDVSLYDMNGKLLESKKTEGSKTSIDMKKLVPATYFLKVVQTQGNTSPKEVKTFKIIKH